MQACSAYNNISLGGGQPFCGVCFKGSSDAVLAQNIYNEYFYTLGVKPPQWLCCWCGRRLLSVLRFQTKIRKANVILNKIRGIEYMKWGDNLKTEIANLKKEYKISETKSIDVFYSEPDYVEVKVEVDIPERREDQQDDETNEGCHSGDDQSDLIPLNSLKTEDDFTHTETAILNYDYEHNRPMNTSIPTTSHPQHFVAVTDVTKPHTSKHHPVFTATHITTQTVYVNQNKQAVYINDKPAGYVDQNKQTVYLNRSKPVLQPVLAIQPMIIAQPSAALPMLTIRNGSIENANNIRITVEGDKKTKEKERPSILAAIDSLDIENYIISETPEKGIDCGAMLEEWEKKKEYNRTLASYNFAKFRCDECVCGFETQDKYDEHLYSHTPVAGVHSCQICSLYFSKYNELKIHQTVHKAIVQCPLCSTISYDMNSAIKHYVGRHSDITFSCHLCITNFKRQVNLEKHLRKYHKNELAIGCAVCGVELEDTATLKKHYLKHNPGEIKLHECSVCKKKSRNAYNMRRHEAAHADDGMPVYCSVCGKTFKQRVQMHTHMKRKHSGKSWKYQCDDCGKFFYSKTEVRMHIQWTHRREGGVSCKVCGKMFRRNYIMVQHMKITHEKKSRPKDKLCDICGRGFASPKTLQSHRYIHTGEKPFPCPDCGQPFRQKCAMMLHYKAKHLRIAWKDLKPKKKKS